MTTFVIVRHGENYEEVAERGKAIFSEMAKENPDKTVLVASHNGVIRTILCVLTGNSG